MIRTPSMKSELCNAALKIGYWGPHEQASFSHTYIMPTSACISSVRERGAQGENGSRGVSSAGDLGTGRGEGALRLARKIQ